MGSRRFTVYNETARIAPSGNAIINVPEVVLNLPGRDERIEEYLNYLRYLGEAGIHYMTYGFMGNGLWRSGRATSPRGYVSSDCNMASPDFQGTWMRKGIIATDKGRPLGDLAIKLDYPDLQADIRHVLETGEQFERRVRHDEIDAPYYLARFTTSYRNAGHDIDGVVATFIDVTSMAKSEDRQRTLVAELNHRVKNVLAVIFAIAQQTLNPFRHSPAAFAPAFSARLQAMARAHELLSPQELGRRGHRGPRRSGACALFVDWT